MKILLDECVTNKEAQNKTGLLSLKEECKFLIPAQADEYNT